MRPLNYLAVLIFMVSNSAFSGSEHIDPVPDPDAPPGINELTILNDGDRMSGLIYTANGPGPHPTVLLLHGFPGNEKNLDIAQSLRRAGYNVVFFHYRGAWGSEGNYSVLQVADDALTVLNFLRQPENAQRYRVDTDKLTVLGHSLGGFASLSAGHQDKALVCVGAISPANFALFGAGIEAGEPWVEGFLAYVDGLFMLQGLKGENMRKQLTTPPVEALDISKYGPGLRGKSVFLIVGEQDRVTNPEIMFDPVVAAYSQEKEIRLQHHKISGDHSFSWSRIRLTDMIVSWLNKDCR